MVEVTPVPARKLPQYLAALAASLGGFAFGTTIGWSSPATVLIREQLDLTAAQVAIVAAISPLGAAATVIPLSFVVDRFGRKPVMMILVVPLLIGWSVVLGASYFGASHANIAIPVYCVGRFVAGMAGGGYCVTVPIFIGEIAQAEIRGTVGFFFNLLLVSGITYTYVVSNFADLTVLTGFCLAVPIVFGIVFFVVPETPYQHIRRRNHEAAEKSLKFFRGTGYDAGPELQIMEKVIGLRSAQEKPKFRDSFRTRAAKRSMLIGLGLMFFQQFSGMAVVPYHANTIFKESGSSIKPKHSLLILGSIMILASIVAAIIVDKIGRKILLYVSMTIMGTSHIITALFFVKFEYLANASWIVVLSLCMYIIGFSLGIGPVPWSIMGEVFPNEIKSQACSICSVVNFVLAFLVALTFPYLVKGIGWSLTFVVYATICFLGFLFVAFVCVETKGKTLLEIQELMSANETRQAVS